MRVPAFEELADFVRAWAQVPAEQGIQPDTQFERDLGITGDDGSYLLKSVEDRFCIQLSTKEEGHRSAFGLGRNEYLFNSEGFPIWELLPFVAKSKVRAFTVGELYAAIVSMIRRSP